MSSAKAQARKAKTSHPQPRTPARHRWVWISAVVLVVLISGAVVWHSHTGGETVTPPAIDLTKVDEPTRIAIQMRHDEVARNPTSGSAWGNLGLVLRAYEFPTEARQCLAHAERLDPQNPRWPYFQSLLLAVDAPAEALPKLRQAVRLCGNDPVTPRFRLASLLAEAGEWDAAAAELDPLLKANPQFAPARLLLARREQARGNFAQAIDLARPCTEDPRAAKAAWTLLGILSRRQGDNALADQAARQAASLPPDLSVVDVYESEASLLRGDPRRIGTQMHAMLAAGKLSEAAPQIERLAKDFPAYPDSWLLLGRLQFLQKNLPAAEQSFRRHLALEPNSTQGLFQLGSTLMSLGRLPEAADTFDRATQIKKDFGPAYFNRGLALGRAGRLREATLAFHESLRHNPEHSETYFILADIYLRLGEKQAALPLLQTVQSLRPDDPRLPALRARAESK